MIPKNEAIKKGVTIIDSKQSHNQLLENLKANFPQVIKDNQVDLQAIATLLGLNDKADIQGYELTFTGKGLANALYSTPTQKLLTLETSFIPPHSTESVIARQSQSDNEAIQNIESTCHTEPLGEVSKSLESSPQTPQNFIIRGDNLDALKILKSAYTEKIKMIYIDPPYNTKNENFIYPDNFRKDYQAILQEVGLLEIDENGEEKESETLKFFRNIQGSRTHSGWLAFMLPRLKLARDLLKDDGVIFISIDDNEQANLKILCDEIFGEENFVACIVAESAPAGTQSSNFIAQQHSYCLVYAKTICDNSLSKIMLTDSELTKKYAEKDEYGEFYIERLWKRGIGGRKEDVPSLHFPVYFDEAKDKIYIDDEISDHKNLIKIIPYQSVGVLGRWTWSKEKMKSEKYKLIVKKVNGEYKLHKKQYKQDEIGKLPNSIVKSEIARTEIGSLELKEIMGAKIFDYPKSVKFLKHLIKISTTTPSTAGGGGELSPHSVESSSDSKASLRGSEATEAIHNAESKKLDSGNLDSMDCHDFASAKSRNDDKADSKAQAETTSNSDSKILQEKAQGDKAEAVEMRNRGFQGGGEGSLLDANDRADNAESVIYRSNATPEIILDFFAGSGTTAHAIMELNKEDGGNRRFILVQLDEPINEEKSKVAYDFCKNELKSQNPVISDITIERVKRASIKIADKNFSGFSVLSLSDKPELITDEKGALKLLDSTISPRDKALNLALQSGKPLDKPLESIFENKLYKCEDCLYVIVCDKEVLEYLRNTQNEYIFIDAFSDISLESFLNLDSSLNDRLRVVY